MIAIPDRLRSLVEGAPRGKLRQPEVPVEPERWRVAVGDHARVLERLPRDLDRVRGRAFALECPVTRPGSVAAFIASQIWGFGKNGYGPHRLGQALAHPGLPGILLAARAQVAAGDPVGAFRTLCVVNEVPHVGAAFGSKLLYFVDPHGRALVLDRVLRGWLYRHAGLRLRGGRDEREYAVWLLVAEQWATALRISSEELELIIFTDGLSPDSPWRPLAASQRSQRSAASTGPAVAGAPPARTSRVILLGCVKQKLAHRAVAKTSASPRCETVDGRTQKLVGAHG